MSAVERQLIRHLQTHAADTGVLLRASVTSRRDWASALFTGLRLVVELSAPEEEVFEQWLADLPDLDVPLCRHFVASAEVVARSEGRATIETLVVTEG